MHSGVVVGLRAVMVGLGALWLAVATAEGLDSLPGDSDCDGDDDSCAHAGRPKYRCCHHMRAGGTPIPGGRCIASESRRPKCHTTASEARSGQVQLESPYGSKSHPRDVVPCMGP